MNTGRALLMVVAVCLGLSGVFAGVPSFPVVPTLFIDSFDGAEGIGFNARGQLFVAANKAVWLASPEGEEEERLLGAQSVRQLVLAGSGRAGSAGASSCPGVSSL